VKSTHWIIPPNFSLSFIMNRSAFILGVLLLIFAAACANALQEGKINYHPTEAEKTWITQRLLQIKREYLSYEPMSNDLRWKVVDCADVSSLDPSPEELRKDSLFKSQNQLRQSHSDDEATHGKALYKLWVKVPEAYTEAPDPNQPTDQVIVKRTWKAMPLESHLPHSDKQAIQGADGKWYIQGKEDGLFVLFRCEEKGFQTDEGWLYGIVAANRDTVLSQGIVPNCQGCHHKNEPGRLFGLPQ
jgi:hypothetical protein